MWHFSPGSQFSIFQLRSLKFGLCASNLMHLKGQGPKLGWLKIFVNKVGFTHLCQKLSKWRSAPNLTECPLCFLGVPMDPCKHTRRSRWGQVRCANYWGKTILKTYDLGFLSFLVKELRQTESTKSVHFSRAFIWYHFCYHVSKTLNFLLVSYFSQLGWLVLRCTSVIKVP